MTQRHKVSIPFVGCAALLLIAAPAAAWTITIVGASCAPQSRTVERGQTVTVLSCSSDAPKPSAQPPQTTPADALRELRRQQQLHSPRP